MYQISVYVPENGLTAVKDAMFKAGAGKFNRYENCAWQTLGTGQFKPVAGAHPTIGEIGQLETLAEYKVEMLCHDECLQRVVTAMKQSHPYEEVAYSILKIKHI